MSHHKRKPTPYCLNCHYPTAEYDNFCPKCGQKATDGKVSLHDLIHEFTHSITHIDGKIFTTLRHLKNGFNCHCTLYHGNYCFPVGTFVEFSLSIVTPQYFHKKITKMTNKNLKELSTEELQKKEKQFKILAYTATGVMILLLAFKRFSNVGLVLFPIIFLTQRWSEVQKELKSRSNDETQI
jgi:hypothetical protein